MTLVEIMIVVVIMGMIASAIGIGVFSQARKAKERSAEQEVMAIEQAVELYQQDHANACPTMSQLRQDGQLSRRARERDPWDNDYIISCDNGDVNVHSKGPDGRDGTDDDIPHPGSNANGSSGTGSGGNGNSNGNSGR